MTDKRNKHTPFYQLSAGDQALWRSYTQTVQPLTIKSAVPYPSSPLATNHTKSPSRPRSQTIDAEEYFQALNMVSVFNPAPYMTIPTIPNTSLSSKKSKQPSIIDGRLDLHGMTQSQAYAALLRFINGHYQRFDRTLLVITGKGFMRQHDKIRDQKHVSLAEALPQWLSQPPLNGYIQNFSVAHIKDGGHGAYYIYLRKK